MGERGVETRVARGQGPPYWKAGCWGLIKKNFKTQPHTTKQKKVHAVGRVGHIDACMHAYIHVNIKNKNKISLLHNLNSFHCFVNSQMGRETTGLG